MVEYIHVNALLGYVEDIILDILLNAKIEEVSVKKKMNRLILIGCQETND
jgi:hypothetical protein